MSDAGSGQEAAPEFWQPDAADERLAQDQQREQRRFTDPRIRAIMDEVKQRLPESWCIVGSEIFDYSREIGIAIAQVDDAMRPPGKPGSGTSPRLCRRWSQRAPIDAPDAASIIVAGLSRAWTDG